MATVQAALNCDLCNEDMAPEQFSQAAQDVSGLIICPNCLEELACAATFDARSEVGMVGTCGGRT